MPQRSSTKGQRASSETGYIPGPSGDPRAPTEPMKVRPVTSLCALMRGLIARFAAIALVAAAASIGLGAPGAQADHTQSSIFQDDQLLLYSGTQTVTKTLSTLKSLGVQMIRLTVKWSALAPDPLSYTYPAPYFDPRYPSSYPAANWAPYDRVISIAQRDGIAVNLDLTAPGPLWAMGPKPVTTRAADHWYPSPQQWLYFVYAVGLRYDGSYYRY